MKFLKPMLLLPAILGVSLATGCSEEAQNKLGRAAVTWLEGDYRVTYAAGGHVRTWEVRSGKVTSEPAKGYYYFWARNPDGGKIYVQAPIERTYIEELTD